MKRMRLATLLVTLAVASPASATTVTVEGPLGTTITTPPLELGAPGVLDGTAVNVPGLIGVSATGAPPETAPPPSPTSQTPTPQRAPANATPSAAPPSAAPAGVTQPSDGSERGAVRTKTRSEGASAGRDTRRSPSTDAASPTAESAGSASPESQTSTGGDERARERSRRPSVVRRIVDRVPNAYWIGLLVVFAMAAGFALAGWRERRRALRAEAEALVDPLTGLANRRAFDRRLAEEWKRSERYERPLGLVMLDLDGFKQLNDTRGHKEGDRVLHEAADLIANRLREIDLAARLGGDEFAAICPETPKEGLESLTNSLETWFQELPVGVSIGFAAREPRDETPLDLLERADAAMYRDKHAHNGARPLAVRT